jgi:DNA-binding NtrC family response regulator
MHEIEGGRWAWYGTLLHGLIHLHLGQFDTASAILNSVWNRESPDPQSRPSLLTVEFLGDVHLEQGNAEAALKLYDEVFPQAMALVPKGDIVAELRRRRAECYYLLGRFDEAYEESKTGLDHCREMGDRYEEAATYRILALSAGAVGKAAEARQWFEQGFAYYDDIETPYEWGKLWMSYGDWLLGPHAAEYASRDAAIDAYRAAVEHFDAMGAAAKLEMARRKLAGAQPSTLGEGPGSAAATLHRPRRRPSREAELLRRSEWAREQFHFTTRSRTILDLLDDVAKLAKSDTPILVLGESGTGKELIAAGIHRLSGRSGPYMPINSAAIAKEMFESELFGHVAGSFTGATRDRPGLFEVADQGTVFLDEIAEMPLELQSRLLRFLETGETRRIGANHNVAVHARLVAATNRQRTGLERGDNFRADLYYRLAHAVVVLPPLRQRGEDDLEALIDQFLADFARHENKSVRLSEVARTRLHEFGWPGNVRQLRSVLRRATLLTPDRGEIQEHQLQLGGEKAPSSLVEELEVAERGRIASALEQSRGSRAEAARSLGMKRTTLLNKMRRFGLR